jgi:ribokinase
LAQVQRQMPGANCRLAVMTRGERGSTAIDHTRRWECPAFATEARDTTGAGDSFAGAIAYGLAQRWEVPEMLRFASVVAAHVVGRVGAQIGQPSLDQVLSILNAD